MKNEVLGMVLDRSQLGRKSLILISSVQNFVNPNIGGGFTCIKQCLFVGIEQRERKVHSFRNQN
jgi:hypothetical protein